MKNAILSSFNTTLQLKDLDHEVKLDKNNIINDFIFICYLMGNDFLPHLPSLDIYENAIDTLIISLELHCV